MIAEEVNRYKQDMLDYFHARQVDLSKTESSSSSSHQYYTTSLTRTTYELDGYTTTDFNLTGQIGIANDDEESPTSTTRKSSSGDQFRLKSVSYDQDPIQLQTFLTEDSRSVNETNTVPFYEAFRVPSHLAHTLTLK